MVGSVLMTLWTTVTLPFRLLMKTAEAFGRLTAATLGFVLMVLGVALGVGPAPVVGVPTFVVGLLVMLRSLDRHS